MTERGFAYLLAVGALAFIAGCGSTARYGITYDQRLPEIKSVEIRPNGVAVVSLHAGGITEDRPEITDNVRAAILAELEKQIAEKGVTACCALTPASAPVDAATLERATSLVDAVHGSIFTHHYQCGKARQFDYTFGPILTP